jgi:hypothetical protein
MTTTRIPPIFAERYEGRIPLASAFRKQPVETIEADNLALMDGVIYRVARVIERKNSIYMTLVLYPVAGGRIISHALARRSWIPVYREAV